MIESLRAAAALRSAGARRFYFKYCSTFDSTPRGNIGPVLDALLSDLDERITIVVPSFPDAGRTVYRGHLFVGDELLAESPMRHHPLTPMTDSSVPRLLGAQSSATIRTIGLATVREGADAVHDALRAAVSVDHRTAVVIDAIENADLRTIIAGSAELRIVTGGSGLALGLPRISSTAAREIPIVPGRRAVLSGSASSRTREQVRWARERCPALKLDPAALRASFDLELHRAAAWLEETWQRSERAVPLVYSVDSLDDVVTEEGASQLVEKALGSLARSAVEAGATQLIVAGGESSGEVVAGLGMRMLQIGPEIAPGVAWAAGETAGGRIVNVALKSGNFGDITLFTDAWNVLDERRPAK